ncbi:hypothetical protein BCR36DRAFT_63005 [Piromyces finnis]|uniref:Uncharacterized protein n=1 Tax=Piromyces finnis TaxID=1754191 RepID=A0A1Y1V9W4_9FUNG|nr:hypothetical protein BCR36DRAFT_63005 [Piromyces finnis]|eukprot:ORX50022.1 hypothetical protein BCR36DRAFT_63005 [Piromyces finnis]
MYQAEENSEVKHKLSIVSSIILNASFIFSQIQIQNNSNIEYSIINYYSIFKFIIYINYIICFINTFIVFFNKKKYQIYYSNLDDLSIKKRIIISDINEYVPNWATTYWGIIYYPFYKKYYGKYQKSMVEKHNSIGNRNFNDINKKYMYIKIWDPPFFSLNLFCYYSPLHLLYISQARQENWCKYLFQGLIISTTLHIIVNLCVSLVQDKDLINREVFKEYNEKFVYTKLCIPKFNKCVGTDTDIFDDNQEKLYNQNQFSQNVSFRKMNENYESNSYFHPRNDYYINRDFYDNVNNNNKYNRSPHHYNPNNSFNRSYTRSENSINMDYLNNRNSYIIYDNKYSPIKSMLKNTKFNTYSKNLSFETNDNLNIPKISDVDENGEFIVTNNSNNCIDYDENGYFKSSLRNNYRKEAISDNFKINKITSKKPITLNKASSFNKVSLYNTSNSINKDSSYKRNVSLNKEPSINQSSAAYSTSYHTLSNYSDKRNLSFSDHNKFVIIDKKDEILQDNIYENEKQKSISNNGINKDSIKKFHFIDKKGIHKK